MGQNGFASKVETGMKKLLVSVCVALLATQWIPLSGRAQSIPNPVPVPGSVVDTISMNPTATLAGTGYDLFGASTNGGYDYAFGFAFKVASASQIVAVEFLVSQRDPGLSASALLYKGAGITGSSDLYYWTPSWKTPALAAFNLVSALPAPNDTAFYVLRFETSVPLSLDPNTPYVFVFDPVATQAGTGSYALAHIDQSDGFLSAIGTPGIDVFMPPYLVRRMTDIKKSYLYNTWTFTRIDRRYLVRLISSTQAPAPKPGTIAFTSASFGANENATFVRLTVSRTGGSDGAASVSYATADGSAKAGQDYTATSGTLSWASGDAQDKVIEISITNDSVYEGDEGFSVELSNVSGASLGSPATAQVTIVDDDLSSVPVITVETSTVFAGEPNSGYGRGMFTIKRSGLLTGDVFVRFKFSGTARYGTAASGGDWYLYPSSLTNGMKLNSGTTSASLIVYISNDSIPEPDETVEMTIEPSNDYVVGEPSRATITIKDDETPVVSVAATDPVAGESGTGEGTGEFTFTRVGSTKSEITVAFVLSGTAVEGQDFAPLGGTVVLPAGASSATLLVSPIDDSVWEEDKTLVLTLQTGAGYTVGSPDTATVVIKNDDPLILPVVTVAAADSTADENGGKGVFVFRRTESIDSDLTVHIEVSGTATPETDYVALGNTVNFPAGVGEIIKVVEPINNETVDGDRTVVVTLEPDPGYHVASPDSATVSIMDDDVPIVTVWAVDDTASEYGPGAAVFRFGRAGSLVDPLTVQFSVSGTATAGVDYADIGQSVTFPAGASTVSVVVTPIDDDEVEEEETVTLTIMEGDNYDARFASPATARILDNDVAVGFGDGGLHSAAATAGRAGLAGTSQVDSGNLVDGNALPGSASGQNGADLLSLGLLSAPVVQVQAGYLVLTYERVTPNPGFEYLIEVSHDLINWESAGSKIREIVTQPAEGRELVQAYYLEPLAGGDARFLRLRVVCMEQRASW